MQRLRPLSLALRISLECVTLFVCIFLCGFFFFQAEDGIRDYKVTEFQTCALPIWHDVSRFAGARPRHAFHTPNAGSVPILDVPDEDSAGHSLDGPQSSHRGDLPRYAAVQDQGEPVHELRRPPDGAIRAGTGRRRGAAVGLELGPNAGILNDCRLVWGCNATYFLWGGVSE